MMSSRGRTVAKKVWLSTLNISLLVGLFLLFQNCSGNNLEVDGSESQSVARPEMVCGEQGYQYLLDSYFVQYCAGCHAAGGLSFPPFADKNLEISFKYALSIPKETFIKFSTDNDFCLEEACELKPGEPRYEDLMEWLDNRRTCQ